MTGTPAADDELDASADAARVAEARPSRTRAQSASTATSSATARGARVGAKGGGGAPAALSAAKQRRMMWWFVIHTNRAGDWDAAQGRGCGVFLSTYAFVEWLTRGVVQTKYLNDSANSWYYGQLGGSMQAGAAGDAAKATAALWQACEEFGYDPTLAGRSHPTSGCPSQRPRPRRLGNPSFNLEMPRHL